jgi:hypothetical protein
VPTLFLRDDVTGFIDSPTGACRLETVLIPIGSEVSDEAVRRIQGIASLVAPKVRFKMLHIGSQQPVIVYNEGYQRVLPVELRPGAVVETIVRSASEMGAGLIAMPTEGRHGLSDALLILNPQDVPPRSAVAAVLRLSVILLFDVLCFPLFDGPIGEFRKSAPDATQHAVVLAAVKDAARR